MWFSHLEHLAWVSPLTHVWKRNTAFCLVPDGCVLLLLFTQEPFWLSHFGFPYVAATEPRTVGLDVFC